MGATITLTYNLRGRDEDDLMMMRRILDAASLIIVDGIEILMPLWI